MSDLPQVIKYFHPSLIKTFPIIAYGGAWMQSYNIHREFVEQYGIIAGSFALYAGLENRYADWQPGDIDIYTRSPEDWQTLVNYFQDKKLGYSTNPFQDRELWKTHIYTFYAPGQPLAPRWQLIPPPMPNWVQSRPPQGLAALVDWSHEFFMQDREVAGGWFCSQFDLEPSRHFLHNGKVYAFSARSLSWTSPIQSADLYWAAVHNPILTLQRAMKYESRGFSLSRKDFRWLVDRIRQMDYDEYMKAGNDAGIIPESEMPWFEGWENTEESYEED